MFRLPPIRSLLSNFILWVVVPLSLVLFGVIVASLVAYQRTFTSLLVNRDQQLAALAVEHVSEAMDGYARMLGAVTTASGWRVPSVVAWTGGLTRAQTSLRVFNAGVAAVDANGRLLVADPPDVPPLNPQSQTRTISSGCETSYNLHLAASSTAAATGETWSSSRCRFSLTSTPFWAPS